MPRLATSATACLLLALAACGSPPGTPPDLSPGVPRALAAHRALAIEDLRYELEFSIPAEREAPIRAREVVRFVLDRPRGPLVLDFEAPPENVLGVRALDPSGTDAAREVPFKLENGHLVIEASALAAGENALEIDFVAGDGPLNRNDEFLYTLFVPDRAHRAFPCFDQPDLKARYRLTLETPASWQAVANGVLEERTEEGGRARWRFAETMPLPTYLFSFAAGVFEVEEAERDGRTLRFFHRETDREKLARNREALFDLHAQALGWLERYTGIGYPFGKLDFVLVPAFQYGGMEHPGAILYRDSSLLLEESATQDEELGRASLIAHETAHMWFGDLVTMAWFDDVWLKEVFANFMAAKIVHPAFPEVRHDLRFLLAHHPRAYAVDRSEGANPIRQPLENLREAGTLYGAIIYQKAPIVMRHLEGLVGEEELRQGLRDYLTRYAFSNATWHDLVAILDVGSAQDLTSWSRVWVEEPDRPTVRTELAVEDGRIRSLAFAQSDPRGRGRLWSQRLEVVLGPRAAGEPMRSEEVLLAAERVEVPRAAGLEAPPFVLADGSGLGYGRFEVDPATRSFLLGGLRSLEDPLLRGVGWLTLWDEMLEGRIAPSALLDTAVETLEAETDLQLTERILRDVEALFWRFLPAAGRQARAGELEAFLGRRMEGAGSTGEKASYFRAYRSVATTEPAVERLRALWSGDRSIDGLPLSERDLSALAQELAVREVPGWREILDEQAARIDNPDRSAAFAFVRPALSADSGERAAFFESLRDPANRAREPWVLDALGWLHEPLRAADSERFLQPSLAMLEEIQATGDIFFPRRWLDASFSGHATPAAAATVRGFLAARPDYPPRLRLKILQAADPLFRAAAFTAP